MFSKLLEKNWSIISHLVLSACSWMRVVKMHGAFKPAQVILAARGWGVIVGDPWQRERRAAGSSDLLTEPLGSLCGCAFAAQSFVNGSCFFATGRQRSWAEAFWLSATTGSQLCFIMSPSMSALCGPWDVFVFSPDSFLNGKCSGITYSDFWVPVWGLQRWKLSRRCFWLM